MAKSEGVVWDIASGVGATALMASALRARETRKAQPLVRDELAQHFVAAAKEDAPASAALAERADGDPLLEVLVNVLAARTRFFDEFFAEAVGSGIVQAVILASGLDVRGWRLNWPEGFVVFEIDQLKVLEFKERVLAERAAVPAAELRLIPTDLREDWPTALRDAGFDPAKPTAWLAEGLLPFLPGAAQDALFEHIAELSAPGSRIAVEDLVPDVAAMERLRAAFADQPSAQALFDLAGTDSDPDLWHADDRGDPAQRLADRGWRVSKTPFAQLQEKYNRIAPVGAERLMDAFGGGKCFTAALSG